MIEPENPAPEISDSETLNETIARAASEWTTTDLATIVAGLTTKRELWNLEQRKGSRKLVKSSAISTRASALRGVKL